MQIQCDTMYKEYNTMSTSLDKLRQAMESASLSQGEKKSYDDDKYWKRELDKSGNGYAIVRFLLTLARKRRDEMSYFDMVSKGLGGWYIEKSLTTLSKNGLLVNTTLSCGTLTSKQTENRESVNRSVDFIMCLTSMLFQTHARTKERYSCTIW